MKCRIKENELSPLGMTLNFDQLKTLNSMICGGPGWVFNIAGTWAEIKEVKHGLVTLQLIYSRKRERYEDADKWVGKLLYCRAFDFIYRVHHVMVAEYYVERYRHSPIPVYEQRTKEDWNRRNPDNPKPCFGDGKIFVRSTIYDQQELLDRSKRNAGFN